jgi:hypothetical protein
MLTIYAGGKKVALVRVSVLVSGFTEEEASLGIPSLVDEFQHRPWIIDPNAVWDGDRARLVVRVHYEGEDVEYFSRAAVDEVWDCVIACISFAGEGIDFELDGANPVASA